MNEKINEGFRALNNIEKCFYKSMQGYFGQEDIDILRELLEKMEKQATQEA